MLIAGEAHLSSKTYVADTQKNHLNETALLSTKYKCLNLWKRKYAHFYN